MTEVEAKTKWCPMLQVSVGAGVLGAVSNRSDAFVDHAERSGRCIASACMAWRWGESGWGEPTDRIPTLPGSSVPPGYFYDHTSNEWVRRPEIAHGYCGLAGRP